MEDAIFTIEEAMAYVKIKSRNTFYRFMQDGEIKYINLNAGGKYEIRRFRREDLDAFISKNVQEGEESN